MKERFEYFVFRMNCVFCIMYKLLFYIYKLINLNNIIYSIVSLMNLNYKFNNFVEYSKICII